jgi:hypothetical protein
MTNSQMVYTCNEPSGIGIKIDRIENNEGTDALQVTEIAAYSQRQI